MELDDQSRIEEEIKTKIEAAKKGGGYIYHSDHSIPKDVSFKNYCNIMELVKKYGKYDKPVQPEPGKKLETIAIQPEKTPEKTADKKEEAKKKFSFGFGKKKPAKQQDPEWQNPQQNRNLKNQNPRRKRKTCLLSLRKQK